jgi:hypothetical protein
MYGRPLGKGCWGGGGTVCPSPHLLRVCQSPRGCSSLSGGRAVCVCGCVFVPASVGGVRGEEGLGLSLGCPPFSPFLSAQLRFLCVWVDGGVRAFVPRGRRTAAPLADGNALMSVSSPLRTADTPTTHRARDVGAGATPASSLARSDAQMYKAEVQRLKFQLRTSEGESASSVRVCVARMCVSPCCAL